MWFDLKWFQDHITSLTSYAIRRFFSLLGGDEEGLAKPGTRLPNRLV